MLSLLEEAREALPFSKVIVTAAGVDLTEVEKLLGRTLIFGREFCDAVTGDKPCMVIADKRVETLAIQCRGDVSKEQLDAIAYSILNWASFGLFMRRFLEEEDPSRVFSSPKTPSICIVLSLYPLPTSGVTLSLPEEQITVAGRVREKIRAISQQMGRDTENLDKLMDLIRLIEIIRSLRTGYTLGCESEPSCWIENVSPRNLEEFASMVMVSAEIGYRIVTFIEAPIDARLWYLYSLSGHPWQWRIARYMRRFQKHWLQSIVEPC